MAYQYRTSDQLETYTTSGIHHTYSGHGYAYEFRGRLSDIRQNLSRFYELNWIDRRTRAVIFHLSLYNPNVQLFTCVTIVHEFLPTGAIYQTIRSEPIVLRGKSLTQRFRADVS